ncbi:MAG: VWA domain-containing protein [Thermomicrobiales bacterium]|nr:VWA domain-containing protein [Thermomicrobiales bacterium]
MARSIPVEHRTHRVLAYMIILAMIGALVAAIPIKVSAQQGVQNEVNLQIILDSSGSMAEEVSPGVTRVDAARGALHEIIDILPTDPGINVGLRKYGHLGNNTQAGRPTSCQSSELVVPMDGVDKPALTEQVDAFEAVGWTPIALSLNRSAADFPAASDNVKNAVVLVTDGLETCGGNPCTASRGLINGPGAVVTHVIGFALREDERALLQCIVDESGGLLLGADNAEELRDAIFTVLEEVEVVVTTGELEIESIGGLYPRATVTSAAEATDSNPNAQPFETAFGDTNILSVPAGSYVVAWSNPTGSITQVTVLVESNQKTVIRGSILRFPQGNGEVYVLKDQSGTEIWRAPVEFGDHVWVLPGVYRLQLAEVVGNAAILSLDVQTLPGSVTQIDVSVTP